MALSTVGKHYTPAWQKIQEAIDAQHVRSRPPRVWQGAVGRAGHQEVSLSKGESPRTQINQGLGGRAQLPGRDAHSLSQGMAEQSEGILNAAGTEQRCGVQGSAQLPGAEAPGLFCQRDGPLQQGLGQVVGDEPHAKVQQGALAEGRLCRAEAVHHHLPALIHIGNIGAERRGTHAAALLWEILMPDA